jgi:hypothetical protein
MEHAKLKQFYGKKEHEAIGLVINNFILKN